MYFDRMSTECTKMLRYRNKQHDYKMVRKKKENPEQKIHEMSLPII